MCSPNVALNIWYWSASKRKRTLQRHTMSKFQSKTIKLYEAKGYLVINNIKLSKAGFPDLQCLKDGRTIWIECKELKDTLKPLQKWRIDQLRSIGFEAFCLQDVKGVIYWKYGNRLFKVRRQKTRVRLKSAFPFNGGAFFVKVRKCEKFHQIPPLYRTIPIFYTVKIFGKICALAHYLPPKPHPLPRNA